MNIGLCGYGYFGKILYQKLVELGHDPVVADPAGGPDDDDAPMVHTAIDPFMQDLDAVVIATPPATHLDLVLRSVLAGAHVFCEKPLVYPIGSDASPTHQLMGIRAAAERRNRVVHVDHTLCYCQNRFASLNAAMDVVSVRENPDRSKHGLNVIWDLLVHEVALYVFAFGTAPDSVIVQSIDSGRDRVVVSLSFPVKHKHRIVNIAVENGSSRRRDLMVNHTMIERTGDPLKEGIDPLTFSLVEFFTAVHDGRESVTGLDHALAVTRVLEEVQSQVDEQ